jgi:hypothetical protein
MAKTSSSLQYEQLVLEALEAVSNQRTREIIKQRFGLEDGQRKTLEAIGQKYGITRERVRQVEEAAFSILRQSSILDFFKPAFQSIDDFFIQEGQVVREERLLSCLAKAEHPHPARGAVFFILTIGQPYQRFIRLSQFYPLWTNSEKSLNKAQRLINLLIKKLEKEGRAVPADYILTTCQRIAADLSKRALFSYLDATKQIEQNNFGQYGLNHWPEIKPRGVKDKAYIILKRENRPLHFSQVADLINQNNFGPSPAHPQTVHNELIKDPRFVLVGRGTYALTEWGYQPGTVKEVIAQLLKKAGPLTKDEIIKQVLKNRLVKENTVLINLQNRRFFVRGADGRYSLANREQ